MTIELSVLLQNVLEKENKKDQTSREVVLEQSHKKNAASMIERVNEVLDVLENEISKSCENHIREVAFIIGPTIYSAKEVYLFKLPENYPNKDVTKKIKDDLLRHMVLNPEFIDFISKKIQLTNMYIMIKKPKGDKAIRMNPTSKYQIPATARLAEIELLCDAPGGKLVTQKSLDITKMHVENSNMMISVGQNQKYSEVVLYERNAHTVELLDSNKGSTSYIVSKPNTANELSLLGLRETTQSQEPSDKKGNGETTYVSSVRISANEDSDYREGKKDKMASSEDEFIWYITSGYLPGFKKLSVQLCSINKMRKFQT